MIDEKKIEEAADIFDDAADTFKTGIYWFLNNLWHDASEEPKENCDILIESLNGAYTEYAAYRHNSAQLWSDFVDRSHTTRWLCIDDLLKGGK